MDSDQPGTEATNESVAAASKATGRSGPVVPGQRENTSEQPEAAGKLGLPQATSLIVGSIIGVGIFNLPGSLAAYGPISLIAMALTTVGALALAVMFAAMSRRLPADGGPYAYARAAFGDATGFSNAWKEHLSFIFAGIAFLAGIPIYLRHRTSMSEPAPVPAWRR
jgi:APA family basic amino acid/polyamine antiporter